MNWLMLIVAGLLEVCWALGMKYSNGFTKPFASVATIVLIVISLFLLNQALRTLPVGLAYGVWTGIGTVGTVIMGIILFGESASPARLFCIALIVAGIIGLRILPQG
ncbi:quaternary ammonium compound efflux SMR transporter SugE [Rhizobiaceae bacterium BDR2-2]|uniref:Guanidinium exporter n=1 Tax=Ectorhizobium quercum TaxID=2965071 RepID=A0AAE3SUW4_9HYPH|nr:quaternary ammonium compound efflux SMR transporter SugE [Ectorhizobium quercum]MCX8997537.1 quaternary ammonium compound efflux SMR transporter SugE [Ectorhizobium quercum]